MPFERTPDPFRKKVELEPAAEERLGSFIEDFKRRSIAVVQADKYANENIKNLLIDTIHLLEPNSIIASIVDNRFDNYGGKNLREQFNTWMSLQFVRELNTLKSDAMQDPQRLTLGESTMLSLLIPYVVAEIKAEEGGGSEALGG